MLHCGCAFVGSKPIRGGIPLAFPQFADQGPLRLHGFVRESLWSIVDERCATDEVVLRLRWEDGGYAFTLVYSIRLSESSLGLSIAVMNESSRAMHFTNCFHPYFRVEDSSSVQIRGLGGRVYVDKEDGRRTKVQAEGPVDIGSESVATENDLYFIDRIYANCDANYLELVERPSSGEEGKFLLGIFKSDSCADWVLFNPWKEGKRGDKGPDFDDDGYIHMICIEAANAIVAKTVAAGESIILSQNITTCK